MTLERCSQVCIHKTRCLYRRPRSWWCLPRDRDAARTAAWEPGVPAGNEARSWGCGGTHRPAGPGCSAQQGRHEWNGTPSWRPERTPRTASAL